MLLLLCFINFDVVISAPPSEFDLVEGARPAWRLWPLCAWSRDFDQLGRHGCLIWWTFFIFAARQVFKNSALKYRQNGQAWQGSGTAERIPESSCGKFHSHSQFSMLLTPLKIRDMITLHNGMIKDREWCDVMKYCTRGIKFYTSSDADVAFIRPFIVQNKNRSENTC